MTSNGLAAACRVKLPSSETKRTLGRGIRGRRLDDGGQRSAVANPDK